MVLVGLVGGLVGSVPKVLGALLLGAWYSTWWTDAIRDFGDSNILEFGVLNKKGGLVVVRVLFGDEKLHSYVRIMS